MFCLNIFFNLIFWNLLSGHCAVFVATQQQPYCDVNRWPFLAKLELDCMSHEYGLNGIFLPVRWVRRYGCEWVHIFGNSLGLGYSDICEYLYEYLTLTDEQER